MTRNHYIALADSLGLALRNAEPGDEAYGVEQAVNAIIPVLKADNSSFDDDKFWDHIEAVREGKLKVTT